MRDPRDPQIQDVVKQDLRTFGVTVREPRDRARGRHLKTSGKIGRKIKL